MFKLHQFVCVIRVIINLVHMEINVTSLLLIVLLSIIVIMLVQIHFVRMFDVWHKKMGHPCSSVLDHIAPKVIKFLSI